MKSNYKVISDIIKSRRSVGPHMFSGKGIEDSLILQALDDANWAPSHKNTEPWRFHILKDEGLARFSTFLETELNILDAPEIKIKKTKEKVLKSSHVVIIILARSPDDLIPEWEEVAATACAVQNFWLSIHALGLAGYWSSPSKLISKYNNFSPLASNERCLGWFYLGYPLSDINLNGSKLPLSQKLKWIKS